MPLLLVWLGLLQVSRSKGQIRGRPLPESARSPVVGVADIPIKMSQASRLGNITQTGTQHIGQRNEQRQTPRCFNTTYR
ncbi:hypothetical protein B0T25DRAFT_4493 [Lasiosphaeria hispida]|uniref:Uncharacterized protein n=1 Tax=Lasiosphaeria hispida TaxID=260671 RepID=A0AAJ0HT22_9PEZI|nr:hypothetical protein B0T25DRAFT_4493 [Lasiosphaeria hispida]